MVEMEDLNFVSEKTVAEDLDKETVSILWCLCYTAILDVEFVVKTLFHPRKPVSMKDNLYSMLYHVYHN